MSDPASHQTRMPSDFSSGASDRPRRANRETPERPGRALEALQIQVEVLRIANEELRLHIDKLSAANQRKPDRTNGPDDPQHSSQSPAVQLDNTGDPTRAGIVLVDTDLCVRRFTPPAARMFDLTVDAIGRPVKDINHRFEYGSLVEEIEEVLETSDKWEEKLRDVDGHGYLVRIRPYQLLPAEGLGGAILSFLDLTPRRQNTDVADRGESRYRRLFEDAQEGIVIASPEGEILDANPAACRIFGYTRTELRAMNARELHVSRKQRRSVTRIIEKEGALRDAELEMCQKDGTIVTCRISSVARHGPHGQTEAYQTFIRDISQAKKAQEALRESEEKFRILAENAPMGIVLLQKGEYKYVNSMFAEMLGYSREELSNLSPKDIVHEGDWDGVLQRIRDRINGLIQGVSYTFRSVTKDGETRTLEVRGNRISYHGAPALISTFLDITDRRRLQREILHIQEEERKRFGQDLHDGVGSQLSGLTMMVATIAQRAERQGLNLANELWNIKSLLQDTDRDVRRISRGLTPLNLEEAGLTSALQRLTNSIGTSGETNSYFDADPDIPELSQDIAVHLYWMAQEAVSNAQKHAEANEIGLRLKTDSRCLILEVTDDGRGIPEERDDGLGLNTLQYRAEIIGGQLELTSTPDEGTTVTCRVPLEPTTEQSCPNSR